MSMITKYRPQSFDELIGHEKEVKSIKELLASQDTPHAWMFVGGPGVGKTTIARIIAKELGVSRSGLFEKNAADCRGIDEIRTLIELSGHTQPGSEVTVTILDEMHQLTTPAMNALLKLLEEPPAHAYYILCTSEERKVIPAIKSRVSTFKFKLVSDDKLIDLLLATAKKENITLEEKAIEAIIRNAKGSPRMVLNLLDRCRANPTVAEVNKLCGGDSVEGTEAETMVMDIIDNAISAKTSKEAWNKISPIMKGISKDDDLDGIVGTLIGKLAYVLAVHYYPGVARLMVQIMNAPIMNKNIFVAYIQILVDELHKGKSL